MPFRLPIKLSAKLPMSRFKVEESTRGQSKDFVLQKRRKAFRSDAKYLYRIVTREKTEGFRTKIATSNSLESLKDREWKYIVEELPQLIPPHLNGQERTLWLIAHFTQKALQEHSIYKAKRLNIGRPTFPDEKEPYDDLASTPHNEMETGIPAIAAITNQELQNSDMEEDTHSDEGASKGDDDRSEVDVRLIQDPDHVLSSTEHDMDSDIQDGVSDPDIPDVLHDRDERQRMIALRKSIVKRSANTLLGGLEDANESDAASPRVMSPLIRHASQESRATRPGDMMPPSRYFAGLDRTESIYEEDEAGGVLMPRYYRPIYQHHKLQLQNMQMHETMYSNLQQRYGWKLDIAILMFLNAVVVIHDWKKLLFWLNAYGITSMIMQAMNDKKKGTKPSLSNQQQQQQAAQQQRAPVARRQLTRKGNNARDTGVSGQGSGDKSPRKLASQKSGHSLAPVAEKKALVDIGKTLTNTEEPVRMSWSETDGETFRLRIGPNYGKNKKKAFSKASMYNLVAVDWYQTPNNKIGHIGRYVQLPESDAKVMDEIGMPTNLIVNCKLPDYAPSNPIWGKSKTNGAGFNVVMYYSLKPEIIEDLKKPVPSNSARLLRNFINADSDSPLRKRLKGIARLTNIDDPNLRLGTMAQKLVNKYNETPFLIRTSSSFFYGQDYFEIDIDVHMFSYLSLVGLNGLKERINDLEFDFGVVIQGEPDEELPERLIGAASIRKLDLKGGPRFPAGVEPLAEDLDD